MTTWHLHEYADRWAPEEPPRLVQTFSLGEDQTGLGSPLMNALSELKEAHPRGLPIVRRGPKIVDGCLHAVRHGSEYDALFESIVLAHEWCDYRIYEGRAKYLSGRYREPDDDYMVTSLHIDNFPAWVEQVAPKSVWDWLKEPAL
jgi:hypothetical protein